MENESKFYIRAFDENEKLLAIRFADTQEKADKFAKRLKKEVPEVKSVKIQAN